MDAVTGLQAFDSNAYTAYTLREPAVGTDQLDPCTDVEGNISDA